MSDLKRVMSDTLTYLEDLLSQTEGAREELATARQAGQEPIVVRPIFPGTAVCLQFKITGKEA